MITFPNAKINIGLNVTERRNDGYHNIETLMVGIDWRDVLEVVPSNNNRSSLTVSGRNVDCPVEKNLVMKAYRRMQSIVGLPPVDIYLHKIIPDGAGLGGGSSDAAFTLKSLNELFDLKFSEGELAEIASEIGADCPFFIYNRPMLASGIGTILKPVAVDFSRYKILIIKPDVGVSTKEAYSGITPCRPAKNLEEVIFSRENSSSVNNNFCIENFVGIKNDFEETVFAQKPSVKEIKERLSRCEGVRYVSMSGSGSAVYALFDDVKMAERASCEFKDMTFHLGKII